MRKFIALYTHQKQKKVKAWQEGFAHYNSDGNEIVLFDANHDRISSYRLRAKESIELSSEYDVGRYLLTLEEEQGGEQGEQPSGPGKALDMPSANLLNPSGNTRRVRKLPSLIKPMRARQSAMQAQLAKGAAESASSQRTLTTDSQQSTAASADPKDDSIEYSVLFTTQKTKKVKAWTEGTLTFYPGNHRVVLKDEDGATMTSSLFPKSKAIEAGGEVDHGQYLIQIESIRGQESTASASSAPVGLELQGSLKRRHNALERAPTRRAAGSGLAKNGLQRVRLHKRQSSDEVAEAPSAAGPHSTAASSTAAQRPPKLARGGSLQSSRTANLPLATSTLTRVPFTPPASQTPKYLHFPRRSELLQHVGVSKGYNFGPSRQLTVPITYQRWDDYQRQFSALLQENLMAELSSLAIRYFFMAREKYDSNAQRAQASAQGGSSGGRRGRMLAGRTASIAQVCKSVGVLFFNECTIRQPFMEGMAFRAQLSKGSVQFSKGDSVVLELSRRESYAGYAKDDTWAVSTSEDFPTESTFLARSVFFGPSKSNTLELMLVGEEDAKAAARIFNGSSEEHGKTRRGAQQTRSTPTVVAVRCLDSASDWTMMDTVEEHLRPDTLPCLPHLLGIADEPIPQVAPEVDVQATVAKIEQILGDKRRELSLNSDQFEILRQVVMSAVSIYLPVEGSSPITIVHGPFGTGKSFLVSAIVICLDQIAYEFPEIFGGTGDGGSSLSASSLSGDWLGDGPADVLHTDNAEAASAEVRQPRLRALVSSMTNFAVDNMLRALLKQGYDQFLRIGNLKRISKEILPYVCRSSSSATEDIKELEAMLAETMDEKEQEAIEVAMQRLRQQRIKDAIDAAFVVGATCLSSATAALRSTRFPVVILDEACQIVEPMALIALASAGCRRLVLVGDPLQLPPTLTTRAAKAAEGKGLDRALFDRLVQMGHKPRFLSTQYRCHPRIGSLCNQLFYQGRLQHGIAPEDRLPLFPDVPPLAFLDTAGQEKQSGKSQSFFNKGEMDMAVQLVRRMLMGGIDAESIGVIALYKTQADMLREQLASVLGQRNSVQVSTVDAYQGSEREVIVISCVRTEKIGFIANPNRINVALSRARRHCLILGARRLLESSPMWKRILEYCRVDSEGFMSAQAFLNKLTAAVMDHRGGDSGGGDFVVAAGSNCQQPSAIEEDVLQESVPEDALPDAEADSRSEAGDEGAEHDEEGRQEEHESCDLDEYNDESVVGGLLSQQWPIPDLGDESQEEDILDCLDVDLDEM